MASATALALSAALLHVVWNTLVKQSEDRDLAFLGQFAAGAVLFLPLLLVVGFPDRAAWPHLAASAGIHLAYATCLVAAYRHGDLSMAYPVARGSGAAIAAVVGAIVLGDHLGIAGWVALGVVVVGLLALPGRQATARSVAWALATGVTIGAYTVVDAAGARRSQGFAYVVVLTLATAVVLAGSAAVRGRLGPFATSVRFAWRRYAVAGAALTASYGMVLVAATRAPVGYVAALRESSVVVGAAVGWLLLREPIGRRRLALAAVVAAGLAALVLTG